VLADSRREHNALVRSVKIIAARQPYLRLFAAAEVFCGVLPPEFLRYSPDHAACLRRTRGAETYHAAAPRRTKMPALRRKAISSRARYGIIVAAV